MGRERDAKTDGGKKGMISTLYPRLYLLCGLHSLRTGRHYMQVSVQDGLAAD